MAATALLKFAQGANIGANGRALLGVVGTQVNLTNSVNTDVASWQIDRVYVAPGSALPVATPFAFNNNSGVPAASFTPDQPGSYRFVLSVWNVANRLGSPTSVDIRVFSVPLANGTIMPPAQLWPLPLPSPESGDATAKPNELNFAGQVLGWAGVGGSDGLLNDFLAKSDKSFGDITTLQVDVTALEIDVIELKADVAAVEIVAANAAAAASKAQGEVDALEVVVAALTSDDIANSSGVGGGAGSVSTALDTLDARTPVAAPVNEYDLLQNVKGSWGVEPSAPAPATNDVWSWNGSIWVPRAVGAGAIQPFQADAHTVGLWRLQGDLSNLVDPSNPLTVDAGTEIYADIVPGTLAFYFNGSTRLRVANFVSALALTGDMTSVVVVQLDATPTSSTVLLGHGAVGETQADNILYQMIVGTSIPRTLGWFSESGAGVNASFNTAAPASLPPIHNILLIGGSRINNVVQFYVNGKPFGSPSSALTTPDGGTSGRFYVGGSDGSATITPSLFFGAMVQDVGWTATEWLACYNQVLGPAYGGV